MDEELLERVADNDQAFEADLLMELEDDDVNEEEQERPKTADRGTDDTNVSRLGSTRLTVEQTLQGQGFTNLHVLVWRLVFCSCRPPVDRSQRLLVTCLPG